MKSYESNDWIEYESKCNSRSNRISKLRVSIVNTYKNNRRPQLVFSLPEHLAKSGRFLIGERFNIRWTPDKKLASIYRCKDGFKLALRGGVAKGQSAKAFGSIADASLKITLTEILKNIFFAESLEGYFPEIVSITNGDIVFRIQKN